MSRLNLILDNERSEYLEKLEVTERKTKTQLIKEALDLLFSTKKITPGDDDLREFFGIFEGTENQVDGMEFQNKIRAEWERN